MKKSLTKILSPMLALLIMLSTLTFCPVTASALTSGDFEYELFDDGTAEIIKYSGYGVKITIPSEFEEHTVTRIGDRAFSDRENLEILTIPNSVTYIGEYAFEKCINLKNITIPDGVTFLSEGVFSKCTSLKKITIPNSITSIDTYAFNGCTNLTNVVIPDSVTKIERSAFLGCHNLKSVTIPASVKIIGDYAFGYNYYDNWYSEIVKDFTITGYKYSSAYKYARENGFDFTSIGEVSPFVYADLADGTIQLANYTGDDSEIIIPNVVDNKTVTRIGDKAFSGCTNLSNITLPDSVTSIGDSAFLNCSNLTSITIPANVTSIGFRAFYGCTKISSVTIPKSVTYIGSQAFGRYSYVDDYDESIEKIDGFSIIGYTNSAAHKYAKENGFEFIPLDDDIILGDADGDGEMNVKDATHIQMYLASYISADEIDLSVCDVDGDGEINVKDATRIQMILAGFTK